MKCGIGHCGHCQLGPTLVCRDGPVYRWSEVERWLDDAGAVMDGATAKPRLAVWKFASCDGCQLSLLDCEDELLALAEQRRDRLLPRGLERDRRGPVRPLAGRGLDHHAARRRAHPARSARSSRALVTIGACATAGGIQALRNFADVDEFTRVVYASPEYISTLRDLDADQRPRAGRLRAARLPDRQAPAARGDQRASSPAAAARPRTASASSASAAGPSA